MKFKFIYFLLVVFVFSCAKRGTITGGLKDTLAPKLVSSLPKNLSKNFTGKEIKLTFDEYVKLKNANKQLIISPPMKNQVEIMPSNATKQITIKIKDTLLPNTTYSFNFGNAIEDNNESNPLKQFKFAFSTGNVIDSLKILAKVKDAIDKKNPDFVSIMLYDKDDNYSDSIIFKKPPRYITNTLESLTMGEINNIKKGKYKIVAIKDLNGNNKFDPKTEKIGFVKDFISIPNDTVFELELFKQTQKYKAINAQQTSGNKIILGYEGFGDDAKIEVKKGKEIIPFLVTKMPKKDSLNIWFKSPKNDSISVNVVNKEYSKKFLLKVKDNKKDTLSFDANQKSDLPFSEKFTITSSIPLVLFDPSKIKITNKAKKEVKFKGNYNEQTQEYSFDFAKEPLDEYKILALPNAFTDFYGKKSDTLKYKVSTRSLADYCSLRLELENVKRFPVIVELTDKTGKVVAKMYSEKSKTLNFDNLEPNIFLVRLIYDDNKNRIWDPGNFIEKRQSEEVIYFPEEMNIHANFDIIQSFDVGKK